MQEPSSDYEEDEEMHTSDYDQEVDELSEEARIERDSVASEELNEGEFDEFQGGQLDLPSDSDGEEISSQGPSEESDGDDLDEYYRELGIDPKEMRPTYSERPKKAASADKESKLSKSEAKRDQRSQLLMKMMETARSQPNHKILNRIIQVTK